MKQLASLTVSRAGDVVVVSIRGEIDLANASDLEGEILDAVPNGADGLVLDVSGLSYLDSRGVRLLLSVAGRLGWRVLSLAGVEGAFPIEAGTVDACRQLRAAIEAAAEP